MLEQDFDYIEDMKIDPDALDVEWLGQADLAVKYGNAVIYLEKEVALLEEQKKVRRSELHNKAIENPVDCIGKAKPTAGDIEAYYRTDETYKQIVNDLIDKKEEHSYMELAAHEIRYTRKKALEVEVSLFQMQYFAGPETPRDLREEFNRKMGIRMKSNEE